MITDYPKLTQPGTIYKKYPELTLALLNLLMRSFSDQFNPFYQSKAGVAMVYYSSVYLFITLLFGGAGMLIHEVFI